MKSKVIKIIATTLTLFMLFVLVGEFSEILAQTATSTASATPTATPTATPDTLPNAGVSTPTLLGMIVGVIAIFFSLALAL